MTQEYTNFNDFNFSNAINKALEDMKFITPSPIQAKMIPQMLAGRDAIALAQTGTGKTAAFALPILQKLNVKVTGTQALVLAPTRELAIQVAEQFETLSAHLPNISIAVLCGGQEYGKQLKMLRGGAQVVVGTPGRILDHLERGSLKLDNLKTFVIDEADEMLRMGFIEDVETILAKLPDDKQLALFSATMPHRIRQIANNYLNDPVSVEIRMETATVKSIEQRFLFVSHSQKPDALIRILAVEDYQGVIVFVKTKSSTEEVAQFLQEQGMRAMAINGDIQQNNRERIIAQFKQGAIDILVATDVAARGLDVERVSHVINYDIPHDCETYVHRIGRTGRAGRSGVTILFATPKESRMLSVIERHTRQKIIKVQVPNDHAIHEAKQKRFLAQIAQRFESEHLISYRNVIEEYTKSNDVSALDIAAALALILHHDKPWREQITAKPVREFKEPREKLGSRLNDFKKGPRGKGSERSAKMPHPSVAQEMFRIDVGRVHGVKPGNIVGAIANEAGLESRQISGIKIHDDHTTVLLPKGMPKKVMMDLNKAWVCGRQLNLTVIG